MAFQDGRELGSVEVSWFGRLRLAPGEAMPWHRDPFHRVTVVLSGDALAIEYRDGGESRRFDVAPGEADWDEPTDRVHRAINVGEQPYEEITVFFLDRPDAVAQPSDDDVRLGPPRI